MSTQIMLSYRVPESSGFTLKLRNFLVKRGFTVFLDVDNLQVMLIYDL
jgi:hypothetical protein